MTSIIVPCYGSYASFLNDCLVNLKGQTVPTEIIVVSDGQTGGVAETCALHGVTHLVKETTSQPTLINYGFSQAIGECYLDMGVDDFLYPTYCQVAEKILSENPSIDIVAPQYMTFGLQEGIWSPGGLGQETKLGNTMFMGSIVRASLWNKLGGFDEKIPFDTLYDWEFWIRAHLAGAQCHLVHEPLYRYRFQAGATHDLFSAHGTEFLMYAQAKGIL